MNISLRFDPWQEWKIKFPFWDCEARGGGVKCEATKDHFQTSGVDINQQLFEHRDPVFPPVPLYWDGHRYLLWLLHTLKPVRLNLRLCFGRVANAEYLEGLCVAQGQVRGQDIPTTTMDDSERISQPKRIDGSSVVLWKDKRAKYHSLRANSQLFFF